MFTPRLNDLLNAFLQLTFLEEVSFQIYKGTVQKKITVYISCFLLLKHYDTHSKQGFIIPYG